MEQTINQVAAKTLGSANSYAVTTDKFDPTLLNPMPRSSARKDWGITGNEFVGVDGWTCHESTFLLDNGVPVAGTTRFIYDASSEFMVESKSAKLFFNTFDMCKMGSTIEKAIWNYEYEVRKALENVLQTRVDVKFFLPDTQAIDPFSVKFDVIPNSMLSKLGPITDYSGKKSHIEYHQYGFDTNPVTLSTNILRSRCRHTKQKDTGTAFIFAGPTSSQEYIDQHSVLREIISLREVNEFHEFCAEKLFTSIHKNNNDVFVGLLYARRGSLDINPLRASCSELLQHVAGKFLCVQNLPAKTFGQ